MQIDHGRAVINAVFNSGDSLIFRFERITPAIAGVGNSEIFSISAHQLSRIA